MKRMLMALLSIVILFAPTTSFAGGCADVNNSGTLNLMDAAYIINVLYRGGPALNCGTSSTGDCGNVNGDSKLNLMDVAHIINFLYRGGPAPNCGEATDIDGNVYQIVTIGTQVWMAENLKVTHYRNGDPIPNVTESGTWVGLATGAYCNYNNDVNNVATYGRLYNWYAVADNRNIAPAGWHVPTDDEWKQLEMYLGMSQEDADDSDWRSSGNVGGKLKETGTTHWSSPNTGATNESGFTALPGGCRSYFDDGDFDMIGINAGFWSSTATIRDSDSWGRLLTDIDSGILRNGDAKQVGHSVRCVKD